MIRRNTLLGILFLTVGLLAAGAAALLIISEIRGARAEQALEAALDKAAGLLEEADLAAAEQALRDAADHARDRRDWLLLLEHAYRLGAQGAGYEVAADLAERGARALPAETDLTAVAAHAALRAGRAGRARALLSGAPETDRFNALRAEAALTSDSGGPPEDAPTEDRPTEDASGAEQLPARVGAGAFSVLVGLTQESDPERFRAAFDLTGDPRFAVDEAVRLAAVGNHVAAFEALSERDLTGEHLLLSAFLSYDLGEYEQYEAFLRRLEPRETVQAEQMMLQADIALLRGRFSAAGAIYEELRRTDPGFSAEQYLNAAWLSRNDPETAVAILRSRSGRFSSHTGLARAEVMLTLEDDAQAAREELRSRVSNVDDPATLETLEMHLFKRGSGSMQSFVSRLWVLVNRYPDSEVPFRYLGWYLVTTGNWSELAFLTDRGRNQREPDILGLYDGFLAARSEDWETAAAEFSRASPRLWEASFNAGLAALASTAVSRAREYFGEALERLEASTLPVEEQTRNRQRSTVLLFDALAYGVQGSYEEAYRRASRAAELDPQSVRARYLVTRFAERLE